MSFIIEKSFSVYKTNNRIGYEYACFKVASKKLDKFIGKKVKIKVIVKGEE